MADEWIDVSHPQDEWQDVKHEPADANLGNLKFWAAHPYFNSLVVNPAAQVYKSMAPVIDAGSKAIGFPEPENGKTDFGRTIENYNVPPGMPAMASIPG